MSRIGRIPVPIPKGVKVSIEKDALRAEGPKGKMSLRLPDGIKIETKEEKLFVSCLSSDRQARCNFGTVRAHLVNIMTGITEGHKRNLEIQGVGYKAQVQNKKLLLNLGLSHQVEFDIPEGVTISSKKPTEISIEGIDKTLVGDVAAKIRRIKPPEPYKGKGIRYAGELVRKKQGKTVTK